MSNNTLLWSRHALLHSHLPFSFRGANPLLQNISSVPISSCRVKIKALAARKSEKRLRDGMASSKRRNLKREGQLSIVSEETVSNITENDADSGDAAKENGERTATRSSVLKACTVTSGALLALSVLIRQVSHVAFVQEWANLDATTQVSFGFEMWHIKLIIGLVLLITSCRYVLLKTWPDFRESSESANEQVLTSLQPLDYLVVALLPGISEELLFRGALLPSLGLNWKSALIAGAIFGALHLGSGRKYSFALWATFVGFTYGLATITCSSAIVPMAGHSLNNLIGAVLWNYTSKAKDDLNLDKSVDELL